MQVIQDVFPATVVITTPEFAVAIEDLRSAPSTKGDGAHQVNTARIVVTDSRVIIAKDGPQGPTVVFSEAIDPATHYKNPDKQKDSYVQTVTGKKIAFRKDSACGCGSRLRSWTPYKFMNSIKDPSS